MRILKGKRHIQEIMQTVVAPFMNSQFEPLFQDNTWSQIAVISNYLKLVKNTSRVNDMPLHKKPPSLPCNLQARIQVTLGELFVRFHKESV
ncbi:hypothetical protein TNCV_3181011 [Trichonephila clavipes]|nr:hypothetical protein TNCV_3181011 [Trichonephila clavipes]